MAWDPPPPKKKKKKKKKLNLSPNLYIIYYYSKCIEVR